jgi:hypothetical protein
MAVFLLYLKCAAYGACVQYVHRRAGHDIVYMQDERRDGVFMCSGNLVFHMILWLRLGVVVSRALALLPGASWMPRLCEENGNDQVSERCNFCNAAV